MNLYKFRTVNTNNLIALSNRQLWFSNQHDFNDPFEGAFIQDNYVPKEKLSTFVCKPKEEIGVKKYLEMLENLGLKEEGLTNDVLLQKIAEHDMGKLISIVHNSKIVCLSMGSEKNDPITNNLMWSHYADGLRGFCLVFDNDLLQNDMSESSDKAMRPIEVEYKDTPNTLKLEEFVGSEIILGHTDADVVHSVTKTIATKSLDWEYENEMRMMSLSKENFHMYEPNTLKEIVIGEKMPIAHKKLLTDTIAANHPGIAVKEAKLMPNSYKITIIPA